MTDPDILAGWFILITNTLSIIATFGIIFAYFYYFELRVHNEFYYIICISLADLIFDSIMLIDCFFQLLDKPLGCEVQGFLKVFSGQVQFFTIGAFCYIIKENIINGSDISQYYCHYILFCIIFPLTYTGMQNLIFKFQYRPAIFNQYIHVEPMREENCFISLDLMFPCFYGPLWIIIFLILYGSHQVKLVLLRRGEENVTHIMRRYVECLKWYPIILMFCWSLLTFTRILNISGINNVVGLNYINYTFVGLSGLLNSIFIACNSEVNGSRLIWIILGRTHGGTNINRMMDGNRLTNVNIDNSTIRNETSTE